MQIGDDEIEWAVVERLRRMLEASREHEYDVTLAYALSSAIVCWLAQRLRTCGSSEADRRAQALWRRFKAERFARFDADAALAGMSVADALVMIRNGVAHADGRSVRPVHTRKNGRPPVLTGYAVEGREATLLLTASIMVGFGTWLAQEFVTAMSGASDDIVREVNRAIREARP